MCAGYSDKSDRPVTLDADQAIHLLSVISEFGSFIKDSVELYVPDNSSKQLIQTILQTWEGALALGKILYGQVRSCTEDQLQMITDVAGIFLKLGQIQAQLEWGVPITEYDRELLREWDEELNSTKTDI